MELKAYKDAACLEEIKAPQKFKRADATDAGVYKNFTLTAMLGTELASLYLYNGTTYTKLTSPTDYSRTTEALTLVTGLGTNDVLVAVPTNRLEMLFSGNEGDSKVTTMAIYIKRNEGYIYDYVRVTSLDLDQTYLELVVPTVDVTFTEDESLLNDLGVSQSGTLVTGLGTLTAHALQGMLMTVNSAYAGLVLANNTSGCIIDAVAYSPATTDGDVEIFTAGELVFGVDNNGVPLDAGFFPSVIVPTLDVENETSKVWVRNTQVIPATPINFPDQAVRITAVEYLQ